MIVAIDDILKVTETCPGDFLFTPIEDIELINDDKASMLRWEKGNRIPEEKIPDLKTDGVKQIDLLFSNSLYKMLNVLFPQKYKDPSALKSFIEIDKIINTFKNLNRISKRQRYISFLYEMYNLNDFGFNPIIRFNEKIDDEKWNNIKPKISRGKKNARFPILFNEIGIIIFVDLTRQNDSNYIERFRRNAELCSILVQKKADNARFNISSEFNELTDVWTVNDPEKLLNTYIKKNAKLIIVGDIMNERYKSALMEVKNYDKFARFFIADKINPNDSKELLRSIKNAYHKDNYSFD